MWDEKKYLEIFAESAKNGFEGKRFLSPLHQQERLADFEEDTMTLIFWLESMWMIQVKLFEKTRKKYHENQERAEA